MSTENGVATAKLSTDKNFAEYVENHSVEIYIDYRDELSNEQVDLILAGKTDEVRMSIEDNYYSDMDRIDPYWDNMASDLGVDKEEIMGWLDDDGFWPSTYLDDSGWRQLLRNTHVYIRATMWEVEWNLNCWAYGQPLYYSDVKDALKILGINPYDFKMQNTSGSATAGPGTFRGYFPKMSKRVPAVKIKDLNDNMCALYDGVLNFCMSNLEEVAEVMESDSKYVTFKTGTNIVMYEFSGGAGITDAQLIKDVTVKRSEVTFINDGASRYGIQECYGFVGSFWSSGGVRNGK